MNDCLKSDSNILRGGGGGGGGDTTSSRRIHKTVIYIHLPRSIQASVRLMFLCTFGISFSEIGTHICISWLLTGSKRGERGDKRE